MDVNNLLPLINISPPVIRAITKLTEAVYKNDTKSPGNNPFDDICNQAEAQSNKSAEELNEESLQILNDSFLQKELDNIPNMSNISLPEISNETVDCGNESLGILKFPVDDDFGYEIKLNSIEKGLEAEDDLIKQLQDLDGESIKNDNVLTPNKDMNLKGKCINDSILKEACKVAFDISQCFESVSDNEFQETYGYLDATPQPLFEDISDIDTESNAQNSVDTRAVFKKLDQILPSENITERNVENVNSTYKLKSNKNKLHLELLENTDQKEIILQLSTIVNKESITYKDKCFGLNLLDSLANYLKVDPEIKNNVKRYSLESNIISTNDLEVPLDLSIKAKGGSTQIRRSQSFDLPKTKPKPMVRNSFSNKQTHVAQESLTNSTKNFIPSEKLKPKRVDENKIISKRGPLKAVVPVGNMAKFVNKNTPTLLPSGIKKNVNDNRKIRTSNAHRLPIAQSTPERNSSVQGKYQLHNNSKRKTEIPISPLVKTSSLNDVSLSNSEGFISIRNSFASSTTNLHNNENVASNYSIPCREKSSTKKRSGSFGSTSHIDRVRDLVKQSKKPQRISSNLKCTNSTPSLYQSQSNNSPSVGIKQKSLENFSVSQSTTPSRKRSGSCGNPTKEIGMTNLRSVHKTLQEKSILSDINNSLGSKMRFSHLTAKPRTNGSVAEKENAGHKI